MGLREYEQKREFSRTPEPPPKNRKRTSTQRPIFVIQKHQASHLHYDLRLEHQGVLKSWAVPKGPSIDPETSALAIEVEDHPLAYADFEGAIPKGEYGAGTVEIWDRGFYTAERDVSSGLQKGSLKFELSGEKLHGLWSLVRIEGEGERAKWLLRKLEDAHAKHGDERRILASVPRAVRSETSVSSKKKASRSVTTSKRNSTSAARRASVEDFEGARPAAFPEVITPQLAKLSTVVPPGDRWLFEVKFDGYRLLTVVGKNSLQLKTRNGLDWTNKFTEIARQLQRLELPPCILDGEVVAVDDQGKSTFQLLQQSIKGTTKAQLCYYFFDLLYLDGYDVRAVAIEQRRELLQALLANAPASLRFSEVIDSKGNALLEAACDAGFEGIIAKKRGSSYEGTRSGNWLKLRCSLRDDVLVCGFTEGKRSGFGALLLAGRESDGTLRYRGKVGTGFNAESIRELRRLLDPLVIPLPRAQKRTEATSIANLPKSSRGSIWVRPELVIEIKYSERTADGAYRHPVYLGVRGDKPATEVGGDRSKTRRSKSSTPVRVALTEDLSTSFSQKRRRSGIRGTTVAGIPLTNPNKILVPEGKVTKQMLAEYYLAVADHLLPYLRNRPLVLVRCPDGTHKECFYQKHIPAHQSGTTDIGRVPIQEKHAIRDYPVVDAIEGVIALVQLGVLEFHPWPVVTTDSLDEPDYIVIDIDPSPEVRWKEIRQAAVEAREVFASVSLTSFPRLSGGKGVHVVAPIKNATWEATEAFSKALAQQLVTESGGRYVATMSKKKRTGKIFIDYFRNKRGATAIANYSTRARAEAPVCVPLSWEELERMRTQRTFTAKDVLKRLSSLTQDPWADFYRKARALPK